MTEAQLFWAKNILENNKKAIRQKEKQDQP